MKKSDKEWLGRKIHSEAEVERGLARWESEKAEDAPYGPTKQQHIERGWTHIKIATALDRLAERIETS
jgi:hypothetical protein